MLSFKCLLHRLRVLFWLVFRNFHFNPSKNHGQHQLRLVRNWYFGGAKEVFNECLKAENYHLKAGQTSHNDLVLKKLMRNQDDSQCPKTQYVSVEQMAIGAGLRPNRPNYCKKKLLKMAN